MISGRRTLRASGGVAGGRVGGGGQTHIASAPDTEPRATPVPTSLTYGDKKQNNSVRKVSLFDKWCWSDRPLMSKKETDRQTKTLSLTPYTITNSNRVTDLNVKL